MAAAESATARHAVRAPHRAWNGRVFGLTVAAEGPVPGLTSASGGGTRTVVWRRVEVSELRARCRGVAWAPLVDLRREGGRSFMRVVHGPGAGYRVEAPGHGAHLVSPDGRTVWSALPSFHDLRWQRLFFAQPLPLAAALQGIDVFHASAVAVDGSAIALTAPSGTGKTSTAAHLVAAGARFVTDDILAVEEGAGGLLAHPGPARLSICGAELRAVAPARRARLGPRVAGGDKLVLEPPAETRPLPLARMYVLSRVAGAGPPRIEPLRGGVARSMLGSGFLPYLRSPERLLTHLDVCARLVESVPVFAVAIPPTAPALDVAAAIHEHAAAPA